LTLTSVIATATTDRSRAPDRVDAHLQGLQASFWLSAALCYTALLLAGATLHGIGIVSGVSDVKERGHSVSVETAETGETFTSEIVQSDSESRKTAVTDGEILVRVPDPKVQ
jgi:hypothetical protein